MDRGIWVGERWVTATGLHVGRASRDPFRQSNRTIVVVGDSTTRFFYSALLDVFGVRRTYPLHYLPPTDRCSFARVGWPSRGECAWRWRGPCRDSNSGCSYDHRWRGVRMVFFWWHHGLPLRLAPPPAVDLLITSAGVWEAMGTRGDGEYRSAVRSSVSGVVEAVAARFSVVLSNGVCLGMQQAFFPRFRTWPTPIMEQRVLEGNRVLQRYADERDKTAFYDRAPSMLTGNDSQSPCINHHPYGKASDLHVSLVLRHLRP